MHTSMHDSVRAGRQVKQAGEEALPPRTHPVPSWPLPRHAAPCCMPPGARRQRPCHTQQVAGSGQCGGGRKGQLARQAVGWGWG